MQFPGDAAAAVVEPEPRLPEARKLNQEEMDTKMEEVPPAKKIIQVIYPLTPRSNSLKVHCSILNKLYINLNTVIPSYFKDMESV